MKYYISLISLVFNMCFIHAQWPSIDSYRASSAIFILEDMQALQKDDKLYKVMPYFSDIGLMVKRDVIPNTSFIYENKGQKKQYSHYLADVVETLDGLEDSRRISALTALSFYSQDDSYVSEIKRLVEQNKNERSYNDIRDEQVTIIAASGFYDLAEKELLEHSSSINGSRAYMHLAVAKIHHGDLDAAQLLIKKSISKIRYNEPDYETIRQFFHIMSLLGQNDNIILAMSLIADFPGDANKICAKGYYYFGSKNLAKLSALIPEAVKVKYPSYPLTEIGALGAKLGSSQVANAAVGAMNLNSYRQKPVYVMAQLAMANDSEIALKKAIDYAAAIPEKADAAKADAQIWITIAALKLTASEADAKQILTMIRDLEPEHRIKFYLRWNGYSSQRFYTGYY